MNRLEIRTLSRKKLGETTESFWSNSEINTYINLGCSDIAQRTLCLRKSGYISTTAVESNTSATVLSQWSLSSNFPNILGIFNVQFHQNGDTWKKLEHKFRNDLDIEIPGWRDSVGRTLSEPITYNYDASPATPYIYWWDYEEDLIGIYPPCDSSNATSNNLHVFYIYDHTNISDDADSPTLPKPLHLAVVDFVAATGFETRGLQDKANDSWTKYFSRLSEYHTNKINWREDDDIQTKTHRSI